MDSAGGIQKAKIMRIDEPDFGCEGRPDGEPAKDILYLQELVTGEELTVTMEERLLWESGLDEGMIVQVKEGRILL